MSPRPQSPSAALTATESAETLRVVPPEVPETLSAVPLVVGAMAEETRLRVLVVLVVAGENLAPTCGAGR